MSLSGFETKFCNDKMIFERNIKMDLLHDNMKKLYFKFLLPSLGSAMVMSIYTLTDAIVIGKGVGADALAALSFTTPLLCILMATGILFGVGGSVQMNVFRGLGNEAKSNRFFTLSFGALAVVCAVLWIIYLCGMPQIIRLMGANDTLYPYVLSYMKYMDYFLPFAVFSNYIAIFVRADNDPNRAMAGVIMGGILNMILDVVFVFPLQMGIGGAAFASALGMILQVVVGGSHFFSKKNGLHFIKPHDVISSTAVIIGNGIPSFFNEFANGFIVLLFNIQILKYCGSTALSVYSVISNCVILFNSLFTGVGQSIQPIISMNYGAGHKERIATVRKLSFMTIIAMGVLFSLSGVLFPTSVCSVFLKTTPEIEQIAGYAIRVYFIAFLPLGMNLLTSYYLQSVLQARKSLIISFLRNIILSGVGIMVFPLFAGENSLWMVIPCVEVVVFVISVIFLRQDTHS